MKEETKNKQTTTPANPKVMGSMKLIVIVLATVFLALAAIVGLGAQRKFKADKIKLGLDLAGGVSITYEAVDKENVTDEEIEDAKYKMQLRVSEFSTEASVYKDEKNRITIDIPGVSNAEEILASLGKMGAIYFVLDNNYLVADENGPIGYGLNTTIEQMEADGTVMLTGKDIASAKAGLIYNSQGVSQGYGVNFELKTEGAQVFSEYTTRYTGGTIIIIYDGKVVSAAGIREPITGGKGQISGSFTAEEASELASTIRIGALPVEMRELHSSVVGATLGQEAIRTSLVAGAIGFILVIIFMCAYYKLPGVAASLALCLYVGMIVFVLNLFGITLTLSGIAGILLSIGMAVDGNVIIFQRIREELATGKTTKSSLKIGFEKAKSAIIDGNVTTLIAAAVLYFVGTGTIQGFAVTLAIGIILSMFTALTITRLILFSLYDIGFDDEKWYGIQKQRKIIDFVSKGKYYLIGSGTVILAGIIGMIIFGATTGKTLNYGLEFAGGTSFMVEFSEDYTESLNNELEKLVLNETGKVAEIVKISGNNSYIMKMSELTEDERNSVMDALASKYGVNTQDVQIDNISGTISGEMKNDAVKAVIIATIGMLIYIWIRFKDFRYATSAIVCLIHDVLVVLAVYTFSRISVGNTFIACMLTLVGYSINATIVVFDRIRENIADMKKGETFADIANKSITETLSRSINSSLTTFVMVLLIGILGVESIKAFAIPLMVGLICGTYSSVCIAGSLWNFLKIHIKERVEVDYEQQLKANANKYR